jgi:hypothetical protein
VKEGDHVYVLGKEADTVATGTAVDNDRIQVAIETAPGTRLVVRRMYECLAEKDFARMPMLGALSARTELWRSWQDVVDLDKEALTAALEKQGLSRGTAGQCSDLLNHDDWWQAERPMTQ